jgi:small subunit ribosomal protein S7
MPPRLNLLAVPRAFPIRSRAPIERWRPVTIPQLCTPRNRGYADSTKDLPISPDNKGPNTEQSAIPHVSEEAAAMKKSMGETPPELEQGTPIEEIVAGDKEAQAKLPKIMKDALKAQTPSGKRSFSTSAIRRRDPYDGYLGPMGSAPRPTDAAIVESGTSVIADPATRAVGSPAGVKFGLPTLPLPANYNLHHRYDPLIDQMVGLMIQHGKKDVARRVCNHLIFSASNTNDCYRIWTSSSPISALLHHQS